MFTIKVSRLTLFLCQTLMQLYVTCGQIEERWDAIYASTNARVGNASAAEQRLSHGIKGWDTKMETEHHHYM